jgi:uncharacterized membrane protein
MNAFDVALFVHVAAGSTALLVFWVPLVTRKGGRMHRRAGWVYATAMMFLAVTALVVCAGRLLDGRVENDRSAIFFAYVSLFSAISTVAGLRALSSRLGSRALGAAFSVALLAGGLALGTWGLLIAVPLYAAFGALGVVTAGAQLRFIVRPPESPLARVVEHMNGMGISCIATLTAFLVLNASHLGLRPYGLLTWLVPSAIGAVLLVVAKRRYTPSRATGVDAGHPATSGWGGR